MLQETRTEFTIEPGSYRRNIMAVGAEKCYDSQDDFDTYGSKLDPTTLRKLRTQKRQIH